MTVLLKNVPIGSLIKISTEIKYGVTQISNKFDLVKAPITALVLGRGDIAHMGSGNICLGFEEKTINNIGWPIREVGYIDSCVVNAPDHIKYGWWVFETIECMLAVNYKDQVCIGCKRSSPHAEPNNIKGYICLTCKVINDFI